MNNMKRSIKRIFWMIFVLFALILVFMLKLVCIDNERISTNAYNPRLNYEDNTIKRGEIRDINGNTLAFSEKKENIYVRNYTYGSETAHVTGYTGMGKTGVEASENFELQKIHFEPIQRIKNMFFDTEIQGNHVVTTIDIDIQKKVNQLLGTKKGAVVVMEPSTGRILAMSSFPDYDPNGIVKNWDNLREAEDSPLLNRATQGIYPPGSTFKIVTTLAAMESLEDWETFTYDCKGEASFENKVIHCYDGNVHGTVDIHSALTVSCNSYFAELGKRVGSQKLKEVAERLHFNDEKLNFILGYSKSEVALNKNSTESELVETAIGQGKTVATPLFMAMLVSSVANDGLMMEPYIIDHIEYYNGNSEGVTVPKKIDSVMTIEESKKLTEMMIKVINSGTGTAAKVSGYQVAGKTGTAENASGDDHSWFIGFAPVDDPKVAVAIVLENSGKSAKAAPMAGKIINYVLNK